MEFAVRRRRTTIAKQVRALGLKNVKERTAVQEPIADVVRRESIAARVNTAARVDYQSTLGYWPPRFRRGGPQAEALKDEIGEAVGVGSVGRQLRETVKTIGGKRDNILGALLRYRIVAVVGQVAQPNFQIVDPVVSDFVPPRWKFERYEGDQPRHHPLGAFSKVLVGYAGIAQGG